MFEFPHEVKLCCSVTEKSVLHCVPIHVVNCFFFVQDDMIDDAESFVTAAKLLKDRGAYKILVMVTHGLLSADAPELIEESVIDEVRYC